MFPMWSQHIPIRKMLPRNVYNELFKIQYYGWPTDFFFLKQTRCKRGFTIKIIVPLHETKNERNNSEFNLYHAWQWAVLSDPRSPFKDDICFFKCLFKVTRDENSIEQMPQVSWSECWLPRWILRSALVANISLQIEHLMTLIGSVDFEDNSVAPTKHSVFNNHTRIDNFL